jgi:hypothetical protein
MPQTAEGPSDHDAELQAKRAEHERLVDRRDQLRAMAARVDAVSEEIRVLERAAQLYVEQLERLARLEEATARFELRVRELQIQELPEATGELDSVELLLAALPRRDAGAH